MNKKTIIFDADGTLLDSLWVWDNLVLDFLKEKNISVENNLHDILWSMSFNEGIYYIKEKYNLIESFDEINSILESRLKDSYQNKVKLFNNVTTLLKELKKNNYFLLVASASDKDLLKVCFSKHNILNYFDSIITEREYDISKADEKFFTKLIKDYDLNLNFTLLIDDALHSLKSAKRANLKTIGILNNNDKKDFVDNCDVIINSIGELNEESINNCWK
ncbi:MAG: HAD hydrolase-like protein [Sphaerochaetaceae bacterium]|nr:HAD hydrolase-like protein [Sphaerochaetaceae bacterium]